MAILIPDTAFLGIPNSVPPDNPGTSESNPVPTGTIDDIILHQAIGREEIDAMVKFSRSIVIQGIIFDDQVGMINSLLGQDATMASIVDGAALNRNIVSAAGRGQDDASFGNVIDGTIFDIDVGNITEQKGATGDIVKGSVQD